MRKSRRDSMKAIITEVKGKKGYPPESKNSQEVQDEATTKRN